MNRRTYLTIAGTALASSLAGCTSGNTNTTTSTPTESATTTSPSTTERESPISVSAQDVTADSPDVELDISYAVRTQQELPTDPVTLAEGGHTWLLVRMDVTNRSDSSRALRMFQYILEDGTQYYEPIMADEEWALANQSASPGETVTGWVPFHPPTSLQNGTLTVRENTQAAFDVTFTHRPELDARIPQ